ncbi:hypothetical protein [Nocardia sp. NPDC051570]|uniref:hypothetical protein n=1 Tax=Nocardia sp. NPDC051570 TaxID=3364324 RepID=UPI003798BF1E
MNTAQAEKAAAQSELDRMPQIGQLSALESEKLIDVALNLEIRYRPHEQIAAVSVCVVNTGVQKGT